MTDDEQDLIADLLVKWEESWDEGKEISAAELCTEHPQLTSELQHKIDGLKQTAWLKKDAGRPLTDQRLAASKNLSGTVLANRYRLDQLLGRGGYGQVYKSFDLQLHRDVAVKVGHARTSSDLLLDEARRVARLRHPGIVQVHDVGEHEGRMFLVFELIEGNSLADRIRDSKLPIREAVSLVATVAETLHYAHKQGCLHRDIKPENILIGSDGKPLIADFGVACTLEEIEKGRSLSSGTLNYMAPEQIAQETQLLDGRCDVHALGVVLFELLTGQSPFEAKTPAALREQILFRQPTPLRSIAPSLPAELEVICSRALAKHPADRQESAEAFANELRRWLDGSKPRRPWIAWLAGLVALLSTIGVVIWITTNPDTNNTTNIVQGEAIHFDGRTKILTRVERTLPVTLEAWVRPRAYGDDDCQFVVGSDIPTKFGLGLGICGSVLSAEYFGGMLNSDQSVPPEQWSHVAAVFTNSETRLYLNGKVAAVGPGGEPDDRMTTFVIGNVGEDNLTGYFQGEVRSVRITNGERYVESFVPEAVLSSDNQTLALFSATSIQGELVKDLSSNGSDGQLDQIGSSKR